MILQIISIPVWVANVTSTSDTRISNPIFIGIFLIGSPRIYSTKPSTPSLPVSISNTRDFSTDIIHQKADKVDNNSSNDDWLKNSVALSLFGIFVLFFAVFVIVYIYLKCFRKASIAKSSKNAEWQVQYRSLNLDTRQPMRSAYEEPRERWQILHTYLLC